MAPCGAPRSYRRVGTNAEPRLLRGYRCACPQAAGRPIGVGSAEVTQCPAWPTKREGYEETGDKRGGTVGRKLAVSAWGRAWLTAVGTWTRTRVSVGVYSCARKVCLWGSGAWRVGVLRDAVSTCPARWSSCLGATRSQRRSRLELSIPSAGRPRVRAARGHAARPRGLTWARLHLLSLRGVSGACLGRGYACQEETRRGRAAPHSRDSSRSRACARVGEPRGEGARSRARVPRLRPQRPRRGQAGPRRASGECGEPWLRSGDVRRPGPAVERGRLLVLAGRSSSG